MPLKGIIRHINESEVHDAYHLEAQNYSPEEAVSYDTIRYRHNNAPNLFLGYFENDMMIGFINGTRHTGYVQESFTEHLKDGECSCIHSVCVDESRRREGIATQLLKAYVEVMKETEIGIKRIALICHDYYEPLYLKAGFYIVGKSQVVHGNEEWLEMTMYI